MVERIGDWIETYTGKSFYPLDPRPQDICIEDIAHGLSLICRYNGQCKRLYTVAQHSLNCADVAAHLGLTPRIQLLCLLHDAAEAYIADVSKPVKPYLAGYKDIERNIQAVIYRTFDIAPPDKTEADWVKHIDRCVMVAEAKVLMPFQGWGKWVDDADEVEVDLTPWTGEMLEARFKVRFAALKEMV